jgi:fermentation-respiration switch protein FrsA (DUF1100 family)
VPAEHAEPVVADVPVLLATGSVDASTPPAWAEELARRLPRVRHVVIEDLPHYPNSPSPVECHDRAIEGFLRDPRPVAVDASCATSMKPPPFRTAGGPDAHAPR